MEQSQQVLEWQAEAYKKGQAKERAESVLRVARKTFSDPIPAGLATTIRACTDLKKPSRWLDALDAEVALQEFRKLVES